MLLTRGAYVRSLRAEEDVVRLGVFRAGVVVAIVAALLAAISAEAPAQNLTGGAELAGGADVGVSIASSADPVAAGDSFSYVVTVTNHGPDVATNVAVVEQLPPTVVSEGTGAWHCSPAGASAQMCDLGAMAAGASVVILFPVRSTAAGTVTGTSSVSSSVVDPVAANNSAAVTTTVLDAPADLSLTLMSVSPEQVGAGQQLTFEVSITNDGPEVARATTLDATFSAPVTFVGFSQRGFIRSCDRLPCLVDDLSPHETRLATLVVAPQQEGALTTTLTVASYRPDPDPADNSISATVTVAPAPDLSIAIAISPNPARVGEDVVVVVTITNQGPSESSSNSLAIRQPYEPHSVSASQGTCGTSGVPRGGGYSTQCKPGPIPSGAQATVVVDVRPVAAATSLFLIFGSFSGDSTPDDDSAIATLTVIGPPEAPNHVSATPGDGRAFVSFQGPAFDGNAPVEYYTVTASPGGQTATGATSPIVVSHLTNGASYTFTVTATNAAGTSPQSNSSQAVVPDGSAEEGRPIPLPPAAKPRPAVPDFVAPVGPRTLPPHE
jgi:uncharacterized repeat protein (TIGR01451 family)